MYMTERTVCRRIRYRVITEVTLWPRLSMTWPIIKEPNISPTPRLARTYMDWVSLMS